MRIVIDSQNPDAIVVDRGRPPTPNPADLSAITCELHQRLSRNLPGTFIHGKTTMRDEVMDMLDCSAVTAERIVDSLVARGHARFRRSRPASGIARDGKWRLAPIDKTHRGRTDGI